jgi:hypothetical protein
MHMVFKCQGAAQIWSALGLDARINEAMCDDRSGAKVFEALLKSPTAQVTGYDEINMQELIAIGAWYIWWLRRRQTHGENIPPIRNCVNSIRAITANAARANKPRVTVRKNIWLKPGAHMLKLNVDAAFSAEEQA